MNLARVECGRRFADRASETFDSPPLPDHAEYPSGRTHWKAPLHSTDEFRENRAKWRLRIDETGTDVAVTGLIVEYYEAARNR